VHHPGVTPAPRTRTSLARGRIQVLLLENVHPGAIEMFRAGGYTAIDARPGSLAGDRLADALAETHILGIRSRTGVTRDVLERAPRLMAIGCFCIGTDQVDAEAARGRGIPVFNAPFSNTRSVAELVLAEIVLLLRGIPAKNAAAHRGEWSKSASGAREARGKVLGVVGYGHIGTQVALLAEALGMQVLYHDIVAKLALGNARPVRSLEALLERADVVTLHVPETPQTRRLIGARQLAAMRPGSALINAARGSVVDLDAVAAALESGHLAGAAVDVFPREPESNDDPFETPLARFDQAILTPHVGGSTIEAQESIGREVAEKLLRYSDNGSTLTAVNFPEVALPEHAGKHRLLHIHENRPGMLARVNEVFSQRGVNVAAQFLQTDARIGYVVIDVDPSRRGEAREILSELAGIEGTIRTRVLY
jgi:D-3-phosphoglycerate dehydrogenase / 2-oxoglutarate reductase